MGYGSRGTSESRPTRPEPSHRTGTVLRLALRRLRIAASAAIVCAIGFGALQQPLLAGSGATLGSLGNVASPIPAQLLLVTLTAKPSSPVVGEEVTVRVQLTLLARPEPREVRLRITTPSGSDSVASTNRQGGGVFIGGFRPETPGRYDVLTLADNIAIGDPLIVQVSSAPPNPAVVAALIAAGVAVLLWLIAQERKRRSRVRERAPSAPTAAAGAPPPTVSPVASPTPPAVEDTSPRGVAWRLPTAVGPVPDRPGIEIPPAGSASASSTGLLDSRVSLGRTIVRSANAALLPVVGVACVLSGLAILYILLSLGTMDRFYRQSATVFLGLAVVVFVVSVSALVIIRARRNKARRAALRAVALGTPGWVGVKGEAWGMQQRGEGGAWTVLSFRVERTDTSTGERLSPVPVEMRGYRFDGSINEGETVAVPGEWTVGTTMEPHYVWNVTTRSWVVARTIGVWGTK